MSKENGENRLKNFRHEVFAHAVLQGMSYKDAALEAGYEESCAQPTGSNLANDTLVKRRISYLRGLRLKRMDIKADYVLDRLIERQEFDVLDLFDENDNLKKVRDWPKHIRQMVTLAELTESLDDPARLLKKLKFPDKTKNLELIGKHVDVNAWKEVSQVDMNANLKISTSLDELFAPDEQESNE